MLNKNKKAVFEKRLIFSLAMYSLAVIFVLVCIKKGVFVRDKDNFVQEIKQAQSGARSIFDLLPASEPDSVYLPFKALYKLPKEVETQEKVKIKPIKKVKELTEKEKTDTIVVVEQKKSEEEIEINKEELLDLSNNDILEDFTPSKDAISLLRQKFENSSQKPVRIAVLGDSFIEGDIFTSSLRHKLQSIYGGEGMGYVPFASVSSSYNSSITHKHSDWKIYSSISTRGTDKTKLTIAGTYQKPLKDSATVVYSCRNGSVVSKARLLFMNEQNSVLTVTVNDAEKQIFDLESSKEMQHLDFEGEISTLSLSVTNIEGFTACGVIWGENMGVSVDNYSVRSAQGSNLLTVNDKLNRSFSRFVDYDLIILQYGLNIVSANVTNYNFYKNKMLKVVSMLKRQYPESVIMIFSVSDRATSKCKSTMRGVPYLVNAQRATAEEGSVVFWNLYEAMGGENSIVKFVDNGWAGKDYVHFNSKGGGVVADVFVKSLLGD